MDGREIRLSVPEVPTDAQMEQLQHYFDELPTAEILAGLKFARSRWQAKGDGVLKVGRKSIVGMETHSVTAEQARWRLENWKVMTANYRKRGYSYPTISRIKRILKEKSEG